MAKAPRGIKPQVLPANIPAAQCGEHLLVRTPERQCNFSQEICSRRWKCAQRDDDCWRNHRFSRPDALRQRIVAIRLTMAGCDRQQIIENIVENCQLNFNANRLSEGYSYGIKTNTKEAPAIAIIADKIWNPALLLLAGQRNLLASLQERMGSEVVLVHACATPSTSSRPCTGAAERLRDRLGWYLFTARPFRSSGAG